MARVVSGRVAMGALMAVALCPFAGWADSPVPAAASSHQAAASADAGTDKRSESSEARSPNANSPDAHTSGSGSLDAARTRRLANRQAFLAAHLAALHAGLQLDSRQEALWSPIETAIRALAAARGHRFWRDASDSTDALKAFGDRLVARGTAIKQLADATGPLLASLSADQKSRLPILLEGLKPRRLLARAFGLDGERMADGPHGEDGWRPRHRFSERGDGDGHGLGWDRDRRTYDDRGDERADRDGSDDGYGHGGVEYERPHHHRFHHDDDGDGGDSTNS